jgi:DNA-binding Lrp family transcriptional regulator
VQQAALDDSDRRVLEQLRTNARASLKEIAQRTGLRPSTVFNRIRRMTDAGVIERFTVRVNPQAVGEDFVVFVLVSGLPEKFADEWLLRNRHVAEAFGVTGEYDLLIKLRFAGKREFNDFIIEFRERYKRSITRTVSMIETVTLKRD